MTYAQLTLPRGAGGGGYSPMLVSEPGRTSGGVYAKIDHSRSLLTGLLSPGCYSGPLADSLDTDGEEVNCGTSLLVGSKSPAEYVIYSPDTPGDRVLLGASARESKV